VNVDADIQSYYAIILIHHSMNINLIYYHSFHHLRYLRNFLSVPNLNLSSISFVTFRLDFGIKQSKPSDMDRCSKNRLCNCSIKLSRNGMNSVITFWDANVYISSVFLPTRYSGNTNSNFQFIVNIFI